MIRVFHLVKSLGRGGAEVLLAENLRHADRDRFEYGYGYFLPHKDAMVEELSSQQVQVTCFGGGGALSMFRRVRDVADHLRGWRADVLHCHLPLAGVVGRAAGRMSGVQVVYTEHNRMERYHAVTRLLNVATWSWQDQVIAVSKEVARSIEEHTRGQAPVKVIANGIDTNSFQREPFENTGIRLELGIPQDVPVVGTVAVFRAQKALDHWLQAARAIANRHPETHFLLVGDGPLREQIEACCRSLGLSGVTHFTGLRQEVRPYLATMDVFLISSLFEGLPLALLEAMAMECSVVSTSVGGIPEVIANGENGYLVSAGDQQLLADRAMDLLADVTLRRSFGQAARKTVVHDFDVRRMSSDLENTYLEVLGSHESERRNRCAAVSRD